MAIRLSTGTTAAALAAAERAAGRQPENEIDTDVIETAAELRNRSSAVFSTGHVRRVLPSDLHASVAHLLSLDVEDRYLRFGYSVSDAALRNYGAGLVEGSDIVVGAFTGAGLVGLCHFSSTGQPAGDGEVGITVSACCRRDGWAQRMLKLAFFLGRSKGILRAHLCYLSCNHAMAGLVRRLGATITPFGPESTGVVATNCFLAEEPVALEVCREEELAHQ